MTRLLPAVLLFVAACSDPAANTPPAKADAAAAEDADCNLSTPLVPGRMAFKFSQWAKCPLALQAVFLRR